MKAPTTRTTKNKTHKLNQHDSKSAADAALFSFFHYREILGIISCNRFVSPTYSDENAVEKQADRLKNSARSLIVSINSLILARIKER